MTASEWRRQKKFGRGTCHKYGKPGHFRRNCPKLQLDRPPTPRSDRMAVAVSHDGDVIVCIGEGDVYEVVGDGAGSGSSGVCGSWVIDYGTTFHICL